MACTLFVCIQKLFNRIKITKIYFPLACQTNGWHLTGDLRNLAIRAINELKDDGCMREIKLDRNDVYEKFKKVSEPRKKQIVDHIRNSRNKHNFERYFNIETYEYTHEAYLTRLSSKDFRIGKTEMIALSYALRREIDIYYRTPVGDYVLTRLVPSNRAQQEPIMLHVANSHYQAIVQRVNIGI